MTTAQASQFAIDTITAAKVSILENGISDAKTLFAICNKLSVMLNLDIDFIISVLEA